jgi:serine/threonine protein kinase
MSDSPDQDATRSGKFASSNVDRQPDHEAPEFRLSEEITRAIEERYELLCMVGRGGMGLVYKARDRVSGDVVALKMINPEIASSSHVIERFKAELRLARKITHKNVCRVYDLSQLGSVHVLSMEYVEGETLRQTLRRDETLSLRHGLRLMRQVIDALDEAHRQGVAHRDLKPENILISSDGSVKVLDFGLARSLSDDTTSTVPGAVLGTPAYMSPEQAAGKPADHRSDVYALGLILYEMFTGRKAFEAETSVALAAKHIHETPSPPTVLEPDLPERIERAILRCLEKDPKKRFNSVRELEAALVERGVLDLSTPPPSGPLELPARLAHWRGNDWLLVFAGFLSILGFFALFDLVLPYHNFQLEISSEEAINRAHTVVHKYLPELNDTEARAIPAFASQLAGELRWPPPLGLENLPGGARLAAQSWAVSVPWQGSMSAHLEYDALGGLTDVSLGPISAHSEVKASTPEEITGFSARCVQDLFGLDVSAIQPAEKYTAEDMRGGRALTRRVLGYRSLGVPNVAWSLPGEIPNTEKHIVVSADRDRLYSASLTRVSTHESIDTWWKQVQESDKYSRASLFGLAFLGLLVLLAVFLSIVRRLYLHTAPALLVVSGVAAIAVAYFVKEFWLRLVDWGSWVVVPTLAVFALALIVSYLVISCAQDYFVRTLPILSKSLLSVFRVRLTETAIGFSIVRGSALGALFLAAHLLTLWFVAKFKLGAPSTVWIAISAGMEKNLLPASFLLGILSVIVVSWLLLALPLSLLHRMGTRGWVQIVCVSILWSAATATLPGASLRPFWLVYIFAGLQGAFFGYIVLQWDWLTAITVTLAAVTWLTIYPIYFIFAKVDGLYYALGLLPWFATVIFGIVVSLRPQILESWRHLKVLFD